MEKSNESPNDSSPDTVTGRSSSEEERKRPIEATSCSTSGDYVTGVGESSSSLDTLIGGGAASHGNQFLTSSSNTIEEIGKKKGRFDALKSTFRKIKRTSSRSVGSEASGDLEPEDEEPSKGSMRARTCGVLRRTMVDLLSLGGQLGVVVSIDHIFLI